MKLTNEQKNNIIRNHTHAGNYEVAKFGCYCDGVFNYYINITDNEKLEIGIIPFDNCQSFLDKELLGDLLNIDFLFFDCNKYTTDKDTWEVERIGVEKININTNTLN